MKWLSYKTTHLQTFNKISAIQARRNCHFKLCDNEVGELSQPLKGIFIFYLSVKSILIQIWSYMDSDGKQARAEG